MEDERQAAEAMPAMMDDAVFRERLVHYWFPENEPAVPAEGVAPEHEDAEIEDVNEAFQRIMLELQREARERVIQQENVQPSDDNSDSDRGDDSDGQSSSYSVDDDTTINNTCCICLDSAADCKLKPCNHANFCMDCALALVEQNRKNRCPLCRSNIFYMRYTESRIDSDDEAADYWGRAATDEEWLQVLADDFDLELEEFRTFVHAQVAMYGDANR